MRKIIYSTLLLFLTFFAVGQELNSKASYIKKNYSLEYDETIKKHALQGWGDDFSMVLFEINKQADALFGLIEAFETENTSIAVKAIQVWSIEGYHNSNAIILKEMKTFELDQLIKLHCDWSMVKYEYDKQVKAKNSF